MEQKKLSNLSDLELAGAIAQSQQIMNQYPALIEELNRRNKETQTKESKEK